MKPVRVKTITQFHRMLSLPEPEHPLISVVEYAKVAAAKREAGATHASISDFYSISVKRGVAAKMRYGQQEYDFDEGVMYFLAPGQVLQSSPDNNPTAKPSGWILLIHPDFFWNNSLAKTIRQYEFFDYAVHEALFLSPKEEATLNNIIENIKTEYHSNIDKFSQNIIISQLETLLNYAERYYQRQFITRKITNHKVLDRVEQILADYFNNEELLSKGLPTVQHLAAVLTMSPKYLSNVLKTATGQTAQQHIHDKLIEKAKEKLSTTDLSVSEIAYELGFEHSQSFSKLFKSKTNFSPSQFRDSFN